MVNIPATKDIIQQFDGNLQVPEIRVWCHPIEGGDDYFKIFDSFKEAMTFIKDNEETAESVALLAFRGYELNLFGIEEVKP